LPSPLTAEPIPPPPPVTFPTGIDKAAQICVSVEDNGGEVECFAEPLEEAMKFPDFVAMLDDKTTELVPYLQVSQVDSCVYD